jgi:hypothetical protein
VHRSRHDSLEDLLRLDRPEFVKCRHLAHSRANVALIRRRSVLSRTHLRAIVRPMNRLVDIDHEMDGGCRPGDRRIAELAARQHGVVARRQLLAMGLRRGAIEHRVARRRLHPLHFGVYAVGHTRLSVSGRWMAAVLACGPAALLSHRCAAHLYSILGTDSARIDVTVTGRSRRGRRGITLHLVRRLHPRDRAVLDGIPVTSTARTLSDLAATPGVDLRRAVDEAERLELFDLGEMEDVLRRSRGRPGIRALKAVLRDYREPLAYIRSDLERLFLDLCRGSGLPLPAVNVFLGDTEVDFLWGNQKLVVELDGYGFHSTRAAFEADRTRDATLQLAGYRVLRITYRRLQRGPEAVLDEVRRLLGL